MYERVVDCVGHGGVARLCRKTRDGDAARTLDGYTATRNTDYIHLHPSKKQNVDVSCPMENRCANGIMVCFLEMYSRACRICPVVLSVKWQIDASRNG